MNQQMNVIRFAIKRIQGSFKIATHLGKDRSQSRERIRIKDFSPVSGDKDQMSMNPVDNVSTTPKFILHRFRPICIMRE